MNRTIFIFLSFLVFACLGKSIACIELGTEFATEVVIGKEGVSWDINKIEKAIDTKKDKIHFGDVEALAYVSHFDSKVGVLIAEENNNNKKMLDILIQIPFKEGGDSSSYAFVEAVNIKAKNFDFKQALKIELEWLKSIGALNGLSNEDIQTISSQAQSGASGYNGRINFGVTANKLRGTYKGMGTNDALQGVGGCGKHVNQKALLKLIEQ